MNSKFRWHYILPVWSIVNYQFVFFKGSNPIYAGAFRLSLVHVTSTFIFYFNFVLDDAFRQPLADESWQCKPRMDSAR